MSYAELASMYPSAGAEFDYTRHAFPEWVSFLVGWVMIVGLIVAAAAVSLGFGRYFGEFVDVDARIPALGLLAALLILGAAGMRQSGRVIVVLSAIQVVGLLAIVVIAVPYVGDHDLTASKGTPGIIGAAALVFFAFIGFDEVITLAEETHNPTRTVPRALLGALAISALLYVATAVAAVSVLGAAELAASERPLADVVDAAAGDKGATMVAIAALISTTNTTLLAITAASRLIFAMAREDALPRTFARISPKTHVPWLSLVVVVCLAAVFTLPGRLGLVAQVTDLSVYIVFVAVNLSVVVLRFRKPNVKRPIRTPLAIRGLPILPILGVGSIAILAPSLELGALGIGLAVCMLGLGAGLIFDSRSPFRRSNVR